MEHKLILLLQDLIPQAGFYGEESGYNNPYGSNYIWIIDPLDGTTNYNQQIPLFCISIALLYNNNIVLGVIYDPIHDQLFYGIKGDNAYCNNALLQVSTKKILSEAVIDMGYSHTIKLVHSYSNLRFRIKTARYLGSVALVCAYVAAGKIDAASFDTINWWDIAAGVLLIELAGGTISGLDTTIYEKLMSNKSNYAPKIKHLLVSNSYIHRELVEIIS